MATLLQELIIEILLWLPVKSLLRFRCVSKSFCAIIESQSFINSHFKRSSENNIHRKLIDLGVHRTGDDLQRIHALEFNDDFQQELVLDKLYPSKSFVHPGHFSHCNGLVLLRVLPCELSLWNPSTRKYRILPAFPVEDVCIGKWCFALGYDSSTDDYKVVVIISKKGWDMSQVWIFELGSSRWRRIQDFPYVDYPFFECGGNGDCFVDGALHFICYRPYNLNPSYIIVAFDIGQETFSVVHEPVYPTKVNASSLHAYQGCLSVLSKKKGCLSVSRTSFLPEEKVDMYVRKKDGIDFTWARLYSLTRHQVSDEAFKRIALRNLAYSKEGNKVFLSFNGKLCSYDLEKQSLQEIASTHNDELDIFAYTESLVSVGS